MESHGCVGKIQVSAETRALLGDAYCFIQREPIQVKGHGQMHTYFLTGKVGMR
jgi:class 3 adenylate cyclase